MSLPLLFTIARTAPHPRIDFDANPEHYTREEVAAHQQRFIALLQQLASPGLPLHAYGLLLPDELNTVISSFNATAHAVAEATLPQLIEAQVTRTPALHGHCVWRALLDLR